MNKLELNWTGKYEEANHTQPEPRILLEKSEYSYQAEPKGQMDVTQTSAPYGNMLIHGDNLLALKSLQQEFSGKIKCIFCDPPYNTQSASEHYEDDLEHSIWLHLMKTRLELLSKLLADDGLIFIEIDNRELHYLKVLMDEVFGRFNYRNSIIVKKGVKNVSIQFKTVEKLNAGYDTILMYSKNPKLRIPNLFAKVIKQNITGCWNNHWRGTDRPTMRYELLGVTPERGQWRWARDRTFRAVHNYEKLLEVNPDLGTFSRENFDRFYQKYLSQNNLCAGNFQLVRLSKNGKPEHYIPPSDKILLSENWLDLSVAGRMTNFEHEKNERILHRIIHWITKSGDIVLDSFLGSGTTAAVAHKMGRRWIGIELGEHAYTHCYPRLKAVCDGEQGGISKEVGWQGGGGFTFYELVPSLHLIQK